jgi:hypothetical protein
MKIFVVLFVVLLGRAAHADDRATTADSLTKLGTTADSLGRTAKASDDRGVRKKFAPKATELGDDLSALAKRTRKDVPLKTIAKELGDLDTDANALIDAADEADDKTERKSLRAQATQLEQAIAAAKKALDAVADDKKDDKKPAAKPIPMKADAFKALLEAVGNANTDADKVSVARAAGANYFTAAQVGQLMDLLNTEMPKVDLASMLWSRLVDVQNGFVIFGKLELSGSKAELHRRVG